MKRRAAVLMLATATAATALWALGSGVREWVRSVDYEPFWSPDGRSVVVVSNRSGAMNLYRLDAETRAPTRLTTHAGPDDTPSWSPDGRRIAFVSEVDGNSEIYGIDADGTNLRRLTHDPGLDLHPTWSPDSARILFNTSRHSRDAADPERIDVCETAADGGGGVRCFTASGINTYASWSPDGASILYRRSRGEGKSQIVRLAAASGEVTELTSAEAFDGWPAWSPTGDRIVFSSDRSGEFQLFTMRADGTEVTRILERPGRYTNPRWSPNGEQILFTGRSPGDGDLELLSIAAPGLLQARFLGNAGFEVSDGASTLLIDFPYQSGAFGYMTFAPEELRARPGSLCLFTHRHDDHFDAAAIERVGCKVAGPADLLARVPAAARAGDGPAWTFGGAEIRCLPTPHARVDHCSYDIAWNGVRWFVSGDTEAVEFLAGSAERYDVLLLTPWVLGQAPPGVPVLVHHHTATEQLPECASCRTPEQGSGFALTARPR